MNQYFGVKRAAYMIKFQGECHSDFLDQLGHLQLFASVIDNVIKAIPGIILEVCFIFNLFLERK